MGATTNWPTQNTRTSIDPGRQQLVDMTFSQSVRSALIDNYANFKGTASLSECGWFSLFFILGCVVVQFCVSVISSFAGVSCTEYGPIGNMAFWAWVLPLYIPNLAVWVRRCHGKGRSTLEAVIIFMVTSSPIHYAALMWSGVIDIPCAA